MAEIIGKTTEISFNVNILIKKEDGLFVAHCLELDLVAAAKTAQESQREIVALVCAQLDYAFANDNLDNLFHPAPAEAWRDFYACKEQTELKYKIDSTFEQKPGSLLKSIIPPWLIAKTCDSTNQLCHA